MSHGQAQTGTVTYIYDDLGRLVQVISPSGDSRTYKYDAVGNLLAIQVGGASCGSSAPKLTAIFPASCVAGTTCSVTLSGSDLLGASLSSSDPLVALEDCLTQCGQAQCLATIDPGRQSGPVAIQASNAFGSAQLTFQTTPPPALTGAGTADTWHFAASKGDVVTISMTRLPGPSGTSQLDPELELDNSNGILIAQDNDSGSSSPPGPGRNAVIKNFALPATDTYLLAARGASGTAGSYTLTIQPSSILLIPGAISSPGPQAPAFSFAGAISATANVGVYSFPANIGTVVTIEVDRVANNPNGSGTLDPGLQLLDSRGFVIATAQDTGTNVPPGPGRNAVIADLRLPATDTYQIQVRGAAGTTGPYTVKVFILQQ